MFRYGFYRSKSAWGFTWITFGFSFLVVGRFEIFSKCICFTSASLQSSGQENLSYQRSYMVTFGSALEVGDLVTLLAQEVYFCARSAKLTDFSIFLVERVRDRKASETFRILRKTLDTYVRMCICCCCLFLLQKRMLRFLNLFRIQFRQFPPALFEPGQNRLSSSSGCCNHST